MNGQELEIVKVLSQFGVAGIVFIIWWIDRREISKRGRMLEEAHRELSQREETLTVLTDLIKENTAALHRLIHVIEMR